VEIPFCLARGADWSLQPAGTAGTTPFVLRRRLMAGTYINNNGMDDSIVQNAITGDCVTGHCNGVEIFRVQLRYALAHWANCAP